MTIPTSAYNHVLLADLMDSKTSYFVVEFHLRCVFLKQSCSVLHTVAHIWWIFWNLKADWSHLKECLEKQSGFTDYVYVCPCICVLMTVFAILSQILSLSNYTVKTIQLTVISLTSDIHIYLHFHMHDCKRTIRNIDLHIFVCFDIVWLVCQNEIGLYSRDFNQSV